MSATIASMAVIGVRQEARGIAAHRMKSADRLTQPKEMPVTLRNDGRKVHRIASGMRRNLRQALKDGVQPLHTAAADVHLAQKQIGHDAHQREHAYDHHPSDSGRRVTMGPKQDSHDDRHLNQRDESENGQRMMGRGDHG